MTRRQPTTLNNETRITGEIRAVPGKRISTTVLRETSREPTTEKDIKHDSQPGPVGDLGLGGGLLREEPRPPVGVMETAPTGMKTQI